MSHSEAANRRRRELYQQARKMGVPSDQAGHIYSQDSYRTRVQAWIDQTRPADATLGQPLQRQLAEEQVRGRPLEYDRHLNHGAYVRVRVRERNVETGERVVRYFTAAFRDPVAPSNGAIAQRVHDILSRPGRSRKSDSDVYEMTGFTILSASVAPDRTDMPRNIAERHRLRERAGGIRQPELRTFDNRVPGGEPPDTGENSA